ncbi:MAG TPA: cyclase family protein [Chloroflexi bacterium]|nr:cyclase family protein [Chloroflexota bacterium]
MHTYDISLTVSPALPVWPGDPPIEFSPLSRIADGESANVTHISMCVHAGTHIDAPLHFLAEGNAVDELDLRLLMGRAFVLHLPDVDLITADVLRQAEIPPRTRRLLFKTRNSEWWAAGHTAFREDYVALSADAAEYLVGRGVKVVGVDYLSVAPFHDTVPTHQILLGGGVVIIEGLNLSGVSEGRYTLYCLPVKLLGTDGAPARAVLVGV